MQDPSLKESEPPSLEKSLACYLQPDGSTPPAIQLHRQRLVKAVKADPSSPEVWWEFLQHEEGLQAATDSLTNQQRWGRGNVTLYHLFCLAVQAVPRQSNYKNEAYLHIWLGYARQQW